MLNVAVIVLLSVDPATETLLIPFRASVLLQPGTYFEEVWSRFITIEFGILLFSIMETIECKKVVSTSFCTSSDISTFPVVAIRQAEPILLKRLFAELDPSRLIWIKLIRIRLSLDKGVSTCNCNGLRDYSTTSADTLQLKIAILVT